MADLRGKRVFVAGHRGMVGSALVRRLKTEDCEILSAGSAQLDLRRADAVEAWFADHRPDMVFVAAARVGGILANSTRPAEFLYDNLLIATNVVHAAHLFDVEKLLFLGSSCIYPKLAPQPIKEEALLTGPLEPTNEWYAVAKIAGIKLCQAYHRQYGRDFISAMPTNLYGPGDNYDLQSSHVLPAMLRKAHLVKVGQAQEMELWGTGEPRREFLHADDCADACVHLMKTYSDEEHVNVGSGTDISIRELGELVCGVVGIDAELRFDRSKPDGTPRKLMDISRLRRSGWEPTIDLRSGVTRTYSDALAAGVFS